MDRVFDHGELNIPLAARLRGFDGQIDRTLAAVRCEAHTKAKAARQSYIANLTEAKALLARIPDARFAELGRPHGKSIKQTREMLLSAARSTPERAKAAFAKDAV